MNRDHVKIVVAAVFLAAAALLLVARSRPRERPQLRDWYLDLKTGQLFAVDASQLPAVPAPSGGEGVRAYVVSCGGGCGEAERRIAYLEKFDEKVKPLVSQRGVAPEEMAANGAKVAAGLYVAVAGRAGAEVQWVQAGSPSGQQIMQQSAKLCPEPTQMKTCTP